MKLYDIVYCTSGVGQFYVGYVNEVFADGDVKIRWWYYEGKRWETTIKFDAVATGVELIGPMPEVEDTWVRLNALNFTTS
jgi:hypothetical protein